LNICHPYFEVQLRKSEAFTAYFHQTLGQEIFSQSHSVFRVESLCEIQFFWI